MLSKNEGIILPIFLETKPNLYLKLLTLFMSEMSKLNEIWLADRMNTALVAWRLKVSICYFHVLDLLSFCNIVFQS